jgi:hypothetical protein
MSMNRSVTATFEPENQEATLTVTNEALDGGSGTVTSQPGGIDCGSDCDEAYQQGTTVTLTASPDSGSVFAGWSDACSGSSSTCVVVMGLNRSVTATFEPEDQEANDVPDPGQDDEDDNGSGSIGCFLSTLMDF